MKSWFVYDIIRIRRKGDMLRRRWGRKERGRDEKKCGAEESGALRLREKRNAEVGGSFEDGGDVLRRRGVRRLGFGGSENF